MKRIISRILLPICFTVLIAVAARAQTSPAANKASATISGRVILDGAGAPGTQVMLKPYVNDVVIPRIGSGVEQPPAPSVATDAEGRYVPLQRTGLTFCNASNPLTEGSQ